MPLPRRFGPDKRVSDGAIFRNHADVACAIDKDAIAREQPVHFIQLRNELIEKFFQLRNKGVRQIADLAADARVGGGEARAGEQLE